MNYSYITIEVNGEPFNCSVNMSIKDILNYLDINPQLVLLEYNEEVIDDKEIDTISLSMNDKLEIITIVGGG